MILKAAWVLPITAPPIRDGCVQLHNGRILAVSPHAELQAADDTWHDLGAAILMPGLVNPHTHLELTCYAGQIAPCNFWDWLVPLVKLRAQPGQVKREQQGTRSGAWQSLRSGVTCVGDISRRNLSWPVLKKLPIRKVCFVELLSLADQPPRNIDELRAGVAAIEEDALLTAGITPHTPFTVPGPQIRQALALAAKRHRPWCTHWAETPQECAFLREGRALHPFLNALLEQCGIHSPHLAPIDYLAQCVGDAPPGALAHYNYPDPGDAERLAAAGHVVMYCPRAHRYFGHSPHPYRDMLAAGVTVALGTDSAASNDDLSLLRELHTLRQIDPHTPPDLRLVTLNAARALGLADQIGSLEAGKLADLVAFPCPTAVPDPVAHLVDTVPAPLAVWVAGRAVPLADAGAAGASSID